MTDKNPKRPRDVNQRAERMVDLVTMDEAELAAFRKKKGIKTPSAKGRRDHIPGNRGSSNK